MKLYAELQVRQAYNEGFSDGYELGEIDIDRTINSLTPIELPSDEEIKEASPKVNEHSHDYYIGEKEGFKDGAKWMKEQILNQKKNEKPN